MHQSNSRNRNIPLNQPCRNSFRNFHSMNKQTSKWFSSGISNDATAYTLSPMDQSRLNSQKYQKNQKVQLSNAKSRRDDDRQCKRNDFSQKKFTPEQDISELLTNFEKPFWKILDGCSSKYSQLVRQCQQQYNYFKQILLHYPEKNHLGSYFNQMHINSTDTKINLLKMLSKQEKKLKSREQKLKDREEQNQQLKADLNKAKKLLKNKEQALIQQLDKNKELENKIAGLAATVKGLEDKIIGLEDKGKKLNDQCQKLQEKQKKIKDDLKAKDTKIKQMQANKQNLQKQLDQIEKKIQGCGLSDTQQSNRPKSSKKIKFRSPKIQEDLPLQNLSGNKNEKKEGATQDDFYRFLFIQATTIEEDLIQQ